MQFSISTTTGVAIYQQLSAQICAAIARGRLRPHERLPSVRELSQRLVVNPNTIARAYTELERDGTLYTRPGMGVFVSAVRPALAPAERRERLLKPLDALLVDAVRLGCAPDEVLEMVRWRMGEFEWSQAAGQAAKE